MVRRAYMQRSLIEVLLPDSDKLWDPTLRHIDTLLGDEILTDRMTEVLARRHPQSQRRGRYGTPATVVLRLLVLKHLNDWSFDECEREVRGSLVYRAFCRIDGERVPDAKTLIRLSQLLDEAVLQDVLALLTFGVATHRTWATVLGSIDWTWVAMNASVAGFFSRYVLEHSSLRPAYHGTTVGTCPRNGVRRLHRSGDLRGGAHGSDGRIGGPIVCVPAVGCLASLASGLDLLHLICPRASARPGCLPGRASGAGFFTPAPGIRAHDPCRRGVLHTGSVHSCLSAQRVPHHYSGFHVLVGYGSSLDRCCLSSVASTDSMVIACHGQQHG
jgi:hypothetical protein